MDIRRWVLAVGPVLLVAAAPWLALWVFAGRLPERAYIDGWSRVGPENAHLAPSWTEWAANHLYALLFGAVMVIVLVHMRRWPPVQRWVIVTACAVAGHIIGTVVFHVVTLVDAPMLPAPWWVDAASVGVGLLAGVVAWHLFGPLPPPVEATGGLPDGVPVRRLRPAERVMFSQSVWSVKAVVLGGVFVLWFVLQPNGTTFHLIMGAIMILQARARIQVDSEGLLLDLPLLRVRRRVPYRVVKHAEAIDRAPVHGWLPLAENTRWSGYVARSGPATVLHMSDGRTFVVSAHESAAALINGELARQRGEAGRC
jgi:hypothetical protein